LRKPLFDGICLVAVFFAQFFFVIEQFCDSRRGEFDFHVHTGLELPTLFPAFYHLFGKINPPARGLCENLGIVARAIRACGHWERLHLDVTTQKNQSTEVAWFATVAG
jgi:hypothetical protein